MIIMAVPCTARSFEVHVHLLHLVWHLQYSDELPSISAVGGPGLCSGGSGSPLVAFDVLNKQGSSTGTKHTQIESEHIYCK